MLITIRQVMTIDACEDGVERMRQRLHTLFPNTSDIDDIQFSIGDVAKINFNDALWCLQLLSDRRDMIRAIMPAVRRASARIDDQYSHDCVAAIEKWLNGDDSGNLQQVTRESWEAVKNLKAKVTGATWAAEAAVTTKAAEAAEVATWAAEAADAAYAAAWATWAMEKGATGYTERAAQVADFVTMFPPVLGD